jgi:small-conductance mechanosensitive channel
MYVQVVDYKTNDISKVYATLPAEEFKLGPNLLHIISVTVTADKYAATHDGRMTFYLSIIEVDPTTNTVNRYNQTVEFDVKVFSSLSAGDNYNRIMGVWESSSDPLITTLVSFTAWLAIAFSVSYLVLPSLITLILREHEKRREVRRYTWKPFFFLIILFGAASCARVYGVGEELTAWIESFANIAYIAVGALVAWRIYRAVLDYVFTRMERKARAESFLIESRDLTGSLRPLLELIGRIVIGMAAITSILASLGFNLMMIITGAGIAGLAVSLGAQNTLSQFFSGITLLLTKPFREGDLITVDNGDVLRVRRVGLMSTEFDKWDTNSIFVLPNNKVSTAAITNITRNTDEFQTNLQINIEYGSDIKLARDLMVETAAEHPRVVKRVRPSARVNSLEDSYMRMRLSVTVDDFRDTSSILGGLRETILRKFEENGVKIASPKIDVNFAGGSAEKS